MVVSTAPEMQALGELISSDNANTMNSRPKGHSWFSDFTLWVTIKQKNKAPGSDMLLAN